MTIKQLCKISHKTAVEKGFWGEVGRNCGTNSAIYKNNGLTRNLSELLMLIVSELGEACEALRKGNRQVLKKQWKKDTFEDELADAMIRIGDLADSEGIDLEWQIKKKLEYNKSRPYKHGKKF
ncbi:hypothetical protein LCGC14_1705600 [marine sediment metagenome]|uniref:NTP pyrophosphohydrolase MazG putative catalytic core domain-containing protein n=1 Tax=marine sediment metagenome TaxID=412755 RepID=A0A0F9I4C5_9ZZZZ